VYGGGGKFILKIRGRLINGHGIKEYEENEK
jgi:hypothetical protein